MKVNFAVYALKTFTVAFVAMIVSAAGCGDESKKASAYVYPDPSGKTYKIVCIGDSTMADYDTVVYPEQRGWAQLLPLFVVNKGTTVLNAAKSGASTKSYYNDANLWTATKKNIAAGDFVLIQFAHNDGKDGGLDGTYGTTVVNYAVNLKKYIDEVKAIGATPIIVTPIVRLNWTDASISEKGMHNLTGNGIAVGDANYAETSRKVAADNSVTCIDMTKSTKELSEKLGAADAKSVMYLDVDDTHLKRMGAAMYARLVVKEMFDKRIFEGDLNIREDLIVNPVSNDFGTRYPNSPAVKVFSLTGLSLSPAEGNIVVSAPDGFSVSSTATGSFAKSVTFAFAGTRLIPAQFYVKFNPADVKSYDGDLLVVAAGGVTGTKVSVKGTGGALPAGSVESSALYPLNASSAGTVSGKFTCTAQAFTGLVGSDYFPANAYNWINVSDTVTLQRITTGDGSWPAETDINASRYAEFSVKVSTGGAFIVDEISMYIGAAGGSSMAYSVYYSTSADFSTKTLLATKSAMPTNTMSRLSISQEIKAAAGSTLYVRIYPWCASASSGKYLCLQNLSVHGYAQ